jgi:hypothetical protein
VAALALRTEPLASRPHDRQLRVSHREVLEPFLTQHPRCGTKRKSDNLAADALQRTLLLPSTGPEPGNPIAHRLEIRWSRDCVSAGR